LCYHYPVAGELDEQHHKYGYYQKSYHYAETISPNLHLIYLKRQLVYLLVAKLGKPAVNLFLRVSQFSKPFPDHLSFQHFLYPVKVHSPVSRRKRYYIRRSKSRLNIWDDTNNKHGYDKTPGDLFH